MNTNRVITTGIKMQGATKKSVKQIEKAVMKVLNSNNNGKTKRAALKIVTRAIPTTMLLTNCSVNITGENMDKVDVEPGYGAELGYSEDTISDGFGLTSPARCHKCGGEMHIIGPGDIRCSNCD